MDLLQILASRIESLQNAECSPGLRSVLQHVQVAANHLRRGQSSSDETAFTDAIYRTNQAFEGSLKEAYRMLAGRDPEKVRPFDIESYLQTERLLRERVVAQLTTYRTGWRNPSTHDYRLDFDEDEALLAIVSVCAFAIVLTDQILEKLSFDSARAAAVPAPATDAAMPLVERVADALVTFRYPPSSLSGEDGPREMELLAAIAGHLSATFPLAHVQTGARLTPKSQTRSDILVSEENERAIIDVRRLRKRVPGTSINFTNVLHEMFLAGSRVGIVYLFLPEGGEVTRQNYSVSGTKDRIIIIGPRD